MKISLPILLLLLVAAAVAGCSHDDSVAAPEPFAGSDEITISGKATSRSFAEFLAAQGTWCFDDGAGGCFLFNDPLPNYLAWLEPEPGSWCLWPDYAGVGAAWIEEETGGAVSLGTSITGSVAERPLADGCALVQLVLHATDALIWGLDFATGELREASGYPDGTLGMIFTTQVNPAQAHVTGNPHWDGFPGEFVKIRPLE